MGCRTMDKMPMVTVSKPLGRRAYGSIGHLPNSRLGPSDHCIPEGQAKICTEDAKGRTVYVEEKLDGSCVAVAKVRGEIIPLTRAGYRATSSPYECHHMFHEWAMCKKKAFDLLLHEGERVVGEWIAQAHGTLYRDCVEPFYAFDIMTGDKRAPYSVARSRIYNYFPMPKLLTTGSTPVEVAMKIHMVGSSAGCEEPEGVVYRVERGYGVEFLAKWVRPDKVDGKYLPSVTGADAIWNWRLL